MATSVTLSETISLKEYEAYETDDKVYLFSRGGVEQLTSGRSMSRAAFEHALQYGAVIIIDKATKTVTKSRSF